MFLYPGMMTTTTNKTATGVSYTVPAMDPYFGTTEATCTNCQRKEVRCDPLSMHLVCDSCKRVQDQVYECAAPDCDAHLSTACLSKAVEEIDWFADGLFCSSLCGNKQITMADIYVFGLDAESPILTLKDETFPLCATVEAVLGRVKSHLSLDGVDLKASTTLERKVGNQDGWINMRMSLAKLASTTTGLAFYDAAEMARQFKMPSARPADADAEDSLFDIDDDDFMGIESSIYEDDLSLPPLALQDEEEEGEGEEEEEEEEYVPPPPPPVVKKTKKRGRPKTKEVSSVPPQAVEKKKRQTRSRITWRPDAINSLMKHWNLTRTQAMTVKNFTKCKTNECDRSYIIEDDDRHLVMVWMTRVERTFMMKKMDKSTFDRILWSSVIAATVYNCPEVRVTALKFVDRTAADEFMTSINDKNLKIDALTDLVARKIESVVPPAGANGAAPAPVISAPKGAEVTTPQLEGLVRTTSLERDNFKSNTYFTPEDLLFGNNFNMDGIDPMFH